MAKTAPPTLAPLASATEGEVTLTGAVYDVLTETVAVGERLLLTVNPVPAISGGALTLSGYLPPNETIVSIDVEEA